MYNVYAGTYLFVYDSAYDDENYDENIKLLIYLCPPTGIRHNVVT